MKSKINLNFCENYYVNHKNLEGLLDYFHFSNINTPNEWKCEKCKKNAEETKRYSIFHTPKILIICINRYLINFVILFLEDPSI